MPTAELVVDQATGRVRQAGATQDEGAWVLELKAKAERSLYVFAKAILGRQYLTPTLHAPVCQWLTTFPPRRKLLLLPREHAKSTLVSQALPLHMLLQPKEANLYFPGEDGADQRIILACETERRAGDHLRVIRSVLEGNELFRALWPHRCWERPSKDAKKWNDQEVIIPRTSGNEWPDPSIRAIGVGGVITGSHPSCLLKDDLISNEAAASPVVMEAAIRWHVASRALINAASALEFIIGTRWANHDLYKHIMETDPSVTHLVRAVIEDGQPIYPEGGFTPTKIAALQDEFPGGLYSLLYCNDPRDPALADFNLDDLRWFTVVGEQVCYEADGRDVRLAERAALPVEVRPNLRGQVLDGDTYDRLKERGTYLRFRT